MEKKEKVVKNTQIERYGWITKEEPLSQVTDKNLDLKISLLESTAPFYGYYEENPIDERPDYLYWILEECYSQERIVRALQTIRAECYPSLDAVPGTITITDDYFHVVRMRNLKRYNQIHPVQEMFEKKGIKLKKMSRKIQNQMGIINLNKFFYLTPIGEGMYLQDGRENLGYFTLPEYIEWNAFKRLTEEVKYDTNLLFFDAGRAAFVEDGNIIELVRIFRENLTHERLAAIRDRYLKLLRQ